MLRLLLFAAIVVPLSGCQLLSQFRAQPVNAPIAYTNMPTREVLLAKINENTEKVRQVSSRVRVLVDGMPHISGDLVVQRPRNLRLQAGILGVTSTGVDIGSNDDQFWIWVKSALPGQSPAIYYASHQDFASSQLQQQVQIEPQWIIDALGLVEFRPEDRHEGPYRRSDGRYEIESHLHSRANPVIRKTVIDAQYGWIVQQAVYSPEGRLLAYVNSTKHRYNPEVGVSLPRHIKIHVPANGAQTQAMTMTVIASEYRINSLTVDPEKVWSMPQPADIRLINLAGANPPTIETPNHSSISHSVNQGWDGGGGIQGASPTSVPNQTRPGF